MTNAEAIDVINRAKQGYGGRLLEALDMAITALEPKTTDFGSVTCMNGENMHDRPTDDIISRKTTIDQIHQSYNLLDAEDRVKSLQAVDAIILGEKYQTNQFCVTMELDTEIYRTDQADLYTSKRTFKVERL